jgi:hypothetical protein
MSVDSSVDQLDLLKDKCMSYGYYGTNYVYKLCNNDCDQKSYALKRHYLVIMSKCFDIKTNETRKNTIFDIKFAKFRANRLKVEKIIDIDTLESIELVCHVPFFDKKYQKDHVTKYAIGEVTCSKKPYKSGSKYFENFYDMDSDKICSFGIHYFLTIEPAYFYRQKPENYHRSWYVYHDDGSIFETITSQKEKD